MVCAEHCGANRNQAFTIWGAAASEITDAARPRRFVMHRPYVPGDGIDIGLFVYHVDDEMPEPFSREREAVGVPTTISALVVWPHEERGVIEVQASNGGTRHSNAWRVG